MLNINDLKADIDHIFDEEFEPIINVQELVDFYERIFQGQLSLSELIAIFDKSIQGRDIRAFVITEEDNFWYFDQSRKRKIFNRINSEISGFCFLLIDNIAFISHCDRSQIYISVKDFEACHKTVVDAYPLDKIYFLRKNNIKKLKPDTTTNNNNPDEITHLNAIIEQQTRTIARLEAEVENLKKTETAQATQPPTVEEKQNRISQPQRDIFTLLVMNNYQNCQSRNRLFEAINADMKVKGIRTSDIKYPTLDNLIDDNLKINNISPFPPKQK